MGKINCSDCYSKMDDKLVLRNEKDKSEKSLSTGKLVSKVENFLKR